MPNPVTQRKRYKCYIFFCQELKKLWEPNLDGGEPLLCTIFNGTSAALGQIASSVLGLRLHQDL